MKRTTADGNDNNRYTEGNPALNIPATVVGAEEMNNIQEEIANTVEAAGITLDGGDENQLLEAINILIAQGGAAPGDPGSPNVSVAINNNIGTPTSVTGLLFDSSKELSARVDYHMERRDDSQSSVETGTLIAYYDSENAAWTLTQESYTPDAQTTDPGVTFTINASGQVQYTSNDYAGASYVGTFKGSIRKVQA